MILKKIYKKLLQPKEKIPIITIKDEKMLLSGKVALILGGSGGIGLAIAKKFLDSGCKVIIAGTSISKLEKIIKDMNNTNLKYVVINLQNYSEFKSCVEQAVELFGKIDILVNSAGIHSTNPIQDYFYFSEEEYDNIFNINLKGIFFFTREIAKYMIENEIQGHILNISSSTALEPAWSPYRLSKWALNGFTKGLADRLLEYGIIVNGIAPGSTATKLLNYEKGQSITTKDNPVNRYIMPEEVAEYAKMLVSDLGNMVIGETILISGGRGNIYVPTYKRP